jgi:hypothetical protein
MCFRGANRGWTWTRQGESLFHHEWAPSQSHDPCSKKPTTRVWRFDSDPAEHVAGLSGSSAKRDYRQSLGWTVGMLQSLTPPLLGHSLFLG